MTRQPLIGYRPDDDLRLLTLRGEGHTWAVIADKMGRSFNSVKGRHSQMTKTGDRSRTTLIDPGDFAKQCERHAQAVMRHGGFVAFSDNGDRRGAFGITLPMVWPEKIAQNGR